MRAKWLSSSWRLRRQDAHSSVSPPLQTDSPAALFGTPQPIAACPLPLVEAARASLLTASAAPVLSRCFFLIVASRFPPRPFPSTEEEGRGRKAHQGDPQGTAGGLPQAAWCAAAPLVGPALAAFSVAAVLVVERGRWEASPTVRECINHCSGSISVVDPWAKESHLRCLFTAAAAASLASLTPPSSSLSLRSADKLKKRQEADEAVRRADTELLSKLTSEAGAATEGLDELVRAFKRDYRAQHAVVTRAQARVGKEAERLAAAAEAARAAADAEIGAVARAFEKLKHASEKDIAKARFGSALPARPAACSCPHWLCDCWLSQASHPQCKTSGIVLHRHRLGVSHATLSPHPFRCLYPPQINAASKQHMVKIRFAIQQLIGGDSSAGEY